MIKQKRCLVVLLGLMVLLPGLWGCDKRDGGDEAKTESVQTRPAENQARKNAPASRKVTFIEIGSVKCIPCRMMQPIIKDIEKEYGDQVEVVFHDVRTPEGKPYGQKYRIRVIPTQVFLDEDGKEYFRHEGFFPKEELVEVLKRKGVE